MARSVLSAVLVLALACTINADLYTKNSPVLQVTAKNYDSLIARSNHTSIVEFYAPWCGHCQRLKPAYEKAAKNLEGLAKVAAVNCDDDDNKPLCAMMGVQGFPTLKIVKPGKKPGRPVVEDYQGAREAKDITEAVKDKIPNHVKRLKGAEFDTWFSDKTSSSAKAVLFTEKGTTSPLTKALAVDFLGSIEFVQVRDKDTAKKYKVDQFPFFILVSAPGADPLALTYNGEMTKAALVEFFSQVASPNPDSASKASKPSKSSKPKNSKASSSASASSSKTSEAHKSSDFDDYMAHSTIVLDDETPTESPIPIVEEAQKPIVIPEAVPAIPSFATPEDLESTCLQPKSGNCILVLLPETPDLDSVLPESATLALTGFAEIAQKYRVRKADAIPMYAVYGNNVAASRLRSDLGLASDAELEVIAINVKRGWWRQYATPSYGVLDLENFIDAIKLGEGVKSKLPETFGEVVAATSSPVEEAPEDVEDLPEDESLDATGDLEEPVAAETKSESATAKPSKRDEL